ncbi:MAG: hypothetical protein ACE5JX_17140 [Acidobacteriota bacterium]
MDTQLSQLREKLDMFVFFHLGSDASVEVREEKEALVVALRHHRVEPFDIRIRRSELGTLVGDPARFENMMLDYLTAHRRS